MAQLISDNLPISQADLPFFLLPEFIDNPSTISRNPSIRHSLWDEKIGMCSLIVRAQNQRTIRLLQ
jgi:hypothetical protein